MQLLFDQGTPVPLRHYLPNHTVETAYEKGWSNIKNGDLLTAAEAEGFEGLIRPDLHDSPSSAGNVPPVSERLEFHQPTLLQP